MNPGTTAVPLSQPLVEPGNPRERGRRSHLPAGRRGDRELDRRWVSRRGDPGALVERARRLPPHQPRHRRQGPQPTGGRRVALQETRSRDVRRHRRSRTAAQASAQRVRRPVPAPCHGRGAQARDLTPRGHRHARALGGSPMTVATANAAASLRDVTMRFREHIALDAVSTEIECDAITGLLGRNGAGKTTLMQLLAGHRVPTSGSVEVFRGRPYENDSVLRRICFIKEGQRSPDHFRVRDALDSAALVFPQWDSALAASLLGDFDLPAKRPIRKLSRGMNSAVRDHHRTAHPRPDHPLRRAVPGPGRGRAAALLRPAAGRLRREPADRRPLHASDRGDRRPARKGPAHRPGTGGARRRRRVAAGQRGDRDRTAGSGGRVRGPTRAPAQRISGRAQPRRRTAERGNGRHRRRSGPAVLGAHQAPATGGGAEPAHRPGRRHRRPGGGLPMNRILAAARLHLVHPLVILGVPWLIVLSSFALNWAIWAVAGLGSEPGGGFTGGILSLYITVLVVFVQSVTRLLPFAMGVSLSRHVFFLGTALLGGVQALGYGVALAVLSAIENATDGWGVGMSFWTPGPLKVDSLLLQVVVSGAPMLAFIFAGVGIGVVYKRWGSSGIWGLTVLGMLILGGVSVLVTWWRAWGDLWAWLSAQAVGTLAIGLPVVLAAVVAALAFAGMRRVVP